MQSRVCSFLFSAWLLFASCNGNDKIASTTTIEKGSANVATSGSISFTLDGKEWKDNNAAATQTGTSFLNIASDNNKTEAISIIINHPAAATFSFNTHVSGSYTDASGASYGSKDGSGNIIVTKYIAPAGKTNGWVEGSFSGNFSLNPSKINTITNGKFSMTVQKL